MSSDRLPSWNWKQGTPTQWFSFTSSKIGFVSRSVRKRFRYPILSENSIYRYWIPYAGEEAAELFDIKVEEANDAVACAGSSMFFCYKNVPTSLTAQGKNAKKKDEQRPLSRQDIKEIFNESFSEYQAREKEKKELLESLNQYGERKQNG